MLKIIRDRIILSKAPLAIAPVKILHVLDSLTMFKEKNLTDSDKAILRKNIAVIFNLIGNYRKTIHRKFPGIIQDNMFNKEIDKGLLALKSLFEFIGKLENLPDEKDEELKTTRKHSSKHDKTIKPIDEPKGNLPELKTKEDAVAVMVVLNNLSRFLTCKLYRW